MSIITVSTFLLSSDASKPPPRWSFEPGSRFPTAGADVLVEWDPEALPRPSCFRTGRGGPEQPVGFLTWQDKCYAHRFQRHTRINSSHNVTRADRSFESPAQNQQLAQPTVVFVF